MTKTPNQINIEKMIARMKKVESISPTMCTAKWLQSTVYLMNGFTHSCHHPSAHKIPLQELEGNPSALHNTKFKKIQRKKMLNGERPEECQYCWNIEDLKGDHISDRVYKSTDLNWSVPYIPMIKEKGYKDDIQPTYLEVAFENTCNFKCAYCSPDISSKWMEEIKQHGAYPTSRKTGDLDWLKQSGKMPIPQREENPYINAFWSWWPELYETLDTFRITGGEPLLSKNTWKILEYVNNNPRQDFNLAVNSNFDVPEEFITRFIDYYHKIEPKIKSFELYTSCEASGEAAEYIRYGMQYDRFMNNVKRYLTETNGRVNFMVTFNALSVTTFEDFLNDVWNLRVDFNEDDAENRIPMMIAYLQWPPFMSAKILSSEIKEKYSDKYKSYMNAHTRNTSPNKAGRFYLEELDQINRLCEFIMGEPDEVERDRKDFAIYFEEYDNRRGTNFAKVFPELEGFRKQCQK